jgi:hypothetical protein
MYASAFDWPLCVKLFADFSQSRKDEKDKKINKFIDLRLCI